MATLKDLTSQIENLSEKENGAKYILRGRATGKELSELREYLCVRKGFFNDALLEIDGQPTLDLLVCDIAAEISADDKHDFVLSLDKNKNECFPIVSVPCLISYFQENFQQGNTLFGFINNAFSSPVIIDNKTALLQNSSSSDETVKIDIFCKAVNFVQRENVKIVPSQVRLEDVQDGNDTDLAKVKTFYKSLINAYSLMFLASSMELKGNKLVIRIDGYKEVECEITAEEIEKKFATMSVYHDLIRWVFNESHNDELQVRDSKQLFLERLGIVRNVFSLEIKPLLEDKDGLYKVTESLLNKCKSSYNVFLKSKTKEYFDLRMKLEEHVEKLIRNLSEESTAFVNSFRNNMYIFISLVFSTLLLTYSRNIGSKGFDDFIAREDVGFVIMGYATLNVVLLFMSSFRLYAANKAIITDKDNFKTRYNKLLDKGDTEDIVESAFVTRIKHNRVFFWIIITLWLSICYILFLNQTLYSYFKGTYPLEDLVDIFGALKAYYF